MVQNVLVEVILHEFASDEYRKTTACARYSDSSELERFLVTAQICIFWGIIQNFLLLSVIIILVISHYSLVIYYRSLLSHSDTPATSVLVVVINPLFTRLLITFSSCSYQCLILFHSTSSIESLLTLNPLKRLVYFYPTSFSMLLLDYFSFKRS